MKKLLATIALAIAIVTLPVMANADTVFVASLDPGQEVRPGLPPVVSEGLGSGRVTLSEDETELAVVLEWSNLNAPPAAAHIHCCAPVGSNATVARWISYPPASLVLSAVNSHMSLIYLTQPPTVVAS